MPFKANSMARVMKEVLFQAKLLHCDFCCLVYSPTFYSRSDGLESRGLRLQHRRELLLGLRGWVSNYDRPFALAGVAADLHSSLTVHYISTPDLPSRERCKTYPGL